MKRLLYSGVVGTVLAFAIQVQGQEQAFVFRGDNQIHVDQISHWSNWVYQNNLVRDVAVAIDSTRLFDFTTSGIKPRFFSNKKNYVIDLDRFEYNHPLPGFEAALIQGNVSALSNSAQAARVGDDDPTTFWEPAEEDFNQDGLRNWQILVDLGRTVWADSIVVLLPPVQSDGELVVPLISESIIGFQELTPEQQAEVERFNRRRALADIVAPADLIDANGDTLVRLGQTLINEGQNLPRDLATLQYLKQLNINSIQVQSEEDLGDVPKLFVLEVSMGKQAGDSSSKNFAYHIVGRASATGNQRRYVFPLEPLDKADFDLDGVPDIPGTFAHFVRLSIFDSDFDQKEFLGEGEEGQSIYEGLVPERQGQRIFQRLTAGGFTKRINNLEDEQGNTVTAETIYNNLPAAEQGPIRYFKRELPRVSEIQVWGPGPNLAYHPRDRAGGGYEDGGRGTPEFSMDGVYMTRWLGNAWDIKYSTGGGGQDALICCTMWMDLGAVFWIDKIVLGAVTTRDNSNEGALFGLHMLGSDGTALRALNMQTFEDFTQLEFGLSWTDLASEIHKNNWSNFNRIQQEAFEEPRRLRFFQMRNDDPTGARSGAYSAQGHFNEVQMYGEGYPAEISFNSPPIILLPGVSEEDALTVKQRSVLSQIHWEGDAMVRRIDPFTGRNIEVAEPLEDHPEVELQIQTRTSDTIDSLFTYFEVSGAGTASERRVEIDVVDYQALSDLWGEFFAWDALPDTKTLRLQTHRSDRDDDRDGVIDEDPIDGIDNDGDKLIDEDGFTGDTGGPNSRGTITLTKHARRTDDDGDGAEDEDPIDGIDNDGDFLIDEDGKKKAAPRQEPQELITPFFAGWSPWSEPYQPTGRENRALITSPSPRKFLQVRVNIVSNDPNVSARMRSLRIDLAPPISTEVVGELAILTEDGLQRPVRNLVPQPLDYGPPKDIPPLDQQAFSFFMRAAGPDPNVDDPEVTEGFDEILLITPTAARLTGVRLGQVKVAELGGASSGTSVKQASETVFSRSFMFDNEGLLRDEDGATIQVVTRGDSLLVQFPESINKEFGDLDNAIVELQFSTKVLNAGTEILSFVRNSSSTSPVFQRVEAEGRDATELVDSRTARPTIIHTAKVVDEIRVSQFVTPNGDGINDQLVVEFTVLSLREDRPIEVGLYDLAGRRVGKAQAANGQVVGQSGVIGFTWDGRDDSGQLVAPGMYIARIELKTDQEDVQTVRLVNVVY
ncbi:MAG: hypothetical protein GKR89_21270 [Candidatus Latescibacteria bacterium]|nr:hypothetical protein [Candidatus Latescibacterota bacterium]